jgi:hypothetical protein
LYNNWLFVDLASRRHLLSDWKNAELELGGPRAGHPRIGHPSGGEETVRG